MIDNVRLPCRFSARRARRRAPTSPRPVAGAAGAGRKPLWKRPAALSVGQQQRVAARAGIGQRELVIADEPTSALDEGRARPLRRRAAVELPQAASAAGVGQPTRGWPGISRARSPLPAAEPRRRRRTVAMTALLALAARSWNRRFVLALIVLSIALATFLLLGIERLRAGRAAELRPGGLRHRPDRRRAPAGAADAVRGLPGRQRDQQHRLGQPVQALAAQRQVAWTVPIALGDSHRGFAVVGTTPAYF